MSHYLYEAKVMNIMDIDLNTQISAELEHCAMALQLTFIQV